MGKAKAEKVKKEKKKMSKKVKIIIICVSVLLVAAIGVGTFFFLNSDYFEIKTNEKWVETAGSLQIENPIDLEPLKVLNPDVKAWIKVDGTEINYPVFKTDNNDFYATHNADKKESEIGALYFDINNTVDAKGNSKNLVIYGQNSENGMMFGSLKNYEDAEYLNKNPKITLYTENGNDEYYIFAVYKTNAFKKDNNDYCFNYRPSTFSTEEAFVDWTDDVKLRSEVNTDIKIEKKDSTLTLVTFGENYADERLVICARKARDEELMQSLVVGPNAKKNEKAIYPQKWYDVKNIEMPKSVAKIYKAEQKKQAEIEKQLAKLK